MKMEIMILELVQDIKMLSKESHKDNLILQEIKQLKNKENIYQFIIVDLNQYNYYMTTEYALLQEKQDQERLLN